MKTITLKTFEIIVNEEFNNFYERQSIDDLIESYKEYGQLTPVHIKEDKTLVNGYRMLEAIKVAGGDSIIAIVLEGEPDIHTRMTLNEFRSKTTADKIRELREKFKRYPRRQGQRNDGREVYERAQKLRAATNGWLKNDVIQNRCEYILNHDLPGDILSKHMIEEGGKIDTIYDYLTKWKEIDLQSGYGYTKELFKGTANVAQINKFIEQRLRLDIKHGHTFVIPEKCNSYLMDCVRLKNFKEYHNTVDLLITSIPYWDLRTYKIGSVRQLGQEETKWEYSLNVGKIFKEFTPLYRENVNVFVNVGETYKDGLAQGIPFLVKDSIEKETPLKYKGMLTWSKKNPRPQGEKIKRPVDNTECILWFVLDPHKSKYNLLTFPVKGKVSKMTHGAKDVSSSGRISKKNKSISKNYGKIMSHLKEQEVENIIVTSVGKNHDVFKISEVGHPAPMSPMLPVTLILMGSDEHDLVFDPFGGSNVVGKVSLELNRRYVSTEISKEYFEIGCEMLILGDDNFKRESLNEINEMIYQTPSGTQDDNLSTAA